MTKPFDGAGNETYWRARLEQCSAPTPMFVDHATGREGEAPAEARRALAGPDARAVERFLGEQQLALRDLARTAWAVLLARYGAEGPVLFGVEEGGRALPFCVDLSLAGDAHAALARVKAESDELARHAATPEEIRACAGLPADAPLFESLVRTAALDPGEAHPGKPTLAVTDANGIELSASVPVSRFDPEAMERLLGHLERLLTGMARDPKRPLQELPILSEEEQRTILHEWNATEAPFPDQTCLHELFERHARETPDAIAVFVDGEGLCYGELDRRANRIAHKLVQLGVTPDTPVGICIERTLLMPAGVLGILKAGGAYVPMDPGYPRERLSFMLEDTDVPVLVTQRSLVPSLPDCKARILCLDDPDEFAECSDESPGVDVDPEHLAYLIFTSGSTGRPKGVMVDHRGRVSNFHDFNTRFGIGPGDSVLALSSLSFDMSAYDLLGTFMTGATAVLVRDHERLEPARWAELIRSHGITIWHSVPALLDMLLRHTAGRDELFPATLRVILLGGDWIPVTLPGRLWEQVPDARVISLGGATEVSMDSTIYEVRSVEESWKSIPYGAPMANQRAYVLDRTGAPAPIGVPGELYLGGVGVGRGYHDRVELTAEKFLDNPWVEGERIYRTGDLARWREDGNLELLGRVDFQVKIRGHRIELGEIEAALREHDGVQEAVLMARERPGGDKQLVAYVLAAYDGAGAARAASAGIANELRSLLEARLPSYMVPAAFVVLDQFPLNPNGKINRRALPEPEADRPDLAAAYEAPRGPLEAALASMWAEVLEIDRVGRHDRFLELGGSSLLAVEVKNRVHEAFEVEVPVQAFLSLPLDECASEVVACGEAAGVDAVAVAAVYQEITALPEERVMRELQERRGHEG